MDNSGLSVCLLNTGVNWRILGLRESSDPRLFGKCQQRYGLFVITATTSSKLATLHLYVTITWLISRCLSRMGMSVLRRAA